MTISNRILSLAAVSVAALVAANATAHAGAFALREQSATAQGMSFAGAASGSGGLSSMFWNPATITMNPGWQSESHAALIVPEAEINPLPGTSPVLAIPSLSGNFVDSGNIGQTAVVPATYGSIQLSDSVWVGLSTNSPYGLVTKPDPVWSGQIYGRTSKIFSVNLNPIAGIKVTDWLSIAAGPTIQYFDVTLKRAVSPAANAPTGRLDGDDVGVGASAGVLFTLPSRTQIGVGYRSSIHHELEGKRINPVGSPVEIPIKASLNLPDTVNIGLSQAITSNFRVHAGFEWANWSRLQAPVIEGPSGPVDVLVLRYKDGFYYSAGAEYDVNQRWTMRAGLAYEESPITDENRTPRLPDNNRLWASIGATYKWSDRLSFDLAYTHIFVRDTKIAIVEGREDLVRAPGIGSLPFVADVDAHVNIISAAVKYRWDTPVAAAVPAGQIVRKY